MLPASSRWYTSGWQERKDGRASLYFVHDRLGIRESNLAVSVVPAIAVPPRCRFAIRSIRIHISSVEVVRILGPLRTMGCRVVVCNWAHIAGSSKDPQNALAVPA